MGSPPSAAHTTPWPRPRPSRAPWPEARWSEGAAPPSRPCRTGTAAPELKRSDDPPHAPWFASATHGPSVYPQPQPSGIPADPFSRSPYEWAQRVFAVARHGTPRSTRIIPSLYQSSRQMTHKADRADTSLARTLEHGLHELATDGLVLHAWGHRDRSHARDQVTFPKKVAADYTPIPFSDNSMDVGSGQQMADEVSRNLKRREVRCEPMLLGDRFERLVADRSRRLGVVRGSRPKANLPGLLVGRRSIYHQSCPDQSTRLAQTNCRLFLGAQSVI